MESFGLSAHTYYPVDPDCLGCVIVVGICPLSLVWDVVTLYWAGND